MRMGIGLMRNKRLAVEDIIGHCFQHKKVLVSLSCHQLSVTQAGFKRLRTEIFFHMGGFTQNILLSIPKHFYNLGKSSRFS